MSVLEMVQQWHPMAVLVPIVGTESEAIQKEKRPNLVQDITWAAILFNRNKLVWDATFGGSMIVAYMAKAVRGTNCDDCDS